MYTYPTSRAPFAPFPCWACSCAFPNTPLSSDACSTRASRSSLPHGPSWPPPSSKLPNTAADQAATGIRLAGRQYTPFEVAQSPIFWVMYIMFVLVGAGGLMATAQLAPIAKDFGIDTVPVDLQGPPELNVEPPLSFGDLRFDVQDHRMPGGELAAQTGELHLLGGELVLQGGDERAGDPLYR